MTTGKITKKSHRKSKKTTTPVVKTKKSNTNWVPPPKPIASGIARDGSGRVKSGAKGAPKGGF